MTCRSTACQAAAEPKVGSFAVSMTMLSVPNSPMACSAQSAKNSSLACRVAAVSSGLKSGTGLITTFSPAAIRLCIESSMRSVTASASSAASSRGQRWALLSTGPVWVIPAW